ncbi:MAG: NUDIX hydrolase [Proteobacteria bacterium]|nr:MAG: NUDIX hydrolase [Pseudomonadota bacterium]
MKKIELLNIEDCKKSLYIKPKSMFYMINGKKKRWDIVDTHNSVAILLYHKQKDSFVFVKQFRPSIYLKNQDGFTYELCAGIMDKGISPEQTALEEIEEETGFKISLDQLEKVSSFYTAVGFAGGRQNLYYATLDDSFKISEGGGDDSEDIEVIYLPRKEALGFVFDEQIATTSGLMFALMWFFHSKEKQLNLD